MTKKINVKAKNDHVLQWAEFKRLYVADRGSDAGQNRKAIPRTTFGDIAQLAKYWHNEYLRELLRNPSARDKSPASRKRWLAAKRKIDEQLRSAAKSSQYPENEWFWQVATRRLAIYLESRKAIPSRTELLIESLRETVEEHAETAKKLAKRAVDAAGGETLSNLKTGVLIVGSLAAAALAIPLIVRALKD